MGIIAMAGKRTHILRPDSEQSSKPSVITVTNLSRPNGVLILQILLIILLAFLGYLVFTIASMAPAARLHFIDTFLNPNLRYFLAS